MATKSSATLYTCVSALSAFSTAAGTVDVNFSNATLIVSSASVDFVHNSLALPVMVLGSTEMARKQESWNFVNTSEATSATSDTSASTTVAFTSSSFSPIAATEALAAVTADLAWANLSAGLLRVNGQSYVCAFRLAAVGMGNELTLSSTMLYLTYTSSKAPMSLEIRGASAALSFEQPSAKDASEASIRAAIESTNAAAVALASSALVLENGSMATASAACSSDRTKEQAHPAQMSASTSRSQC